MKQEGYTQVFLETTTSQYGLCKEPKPFLLDRGTCKDNLVGRTALKKFWASPPSLRNTEALRSGLRQLAGLPT